MAATRAAMRALDAGQVLGVFPEGRIETTREMLPFQTGVPLLAARAGVPIYPAYLDGDQRGREMLAAFVTPCRARILFGDPIVLDRSSSSKQALEASTADIQKTVEGLRQGAGLITAIASISDAFETSG